MRIRPFDLEWLISSLITRTLREYGDELAQWLDREFIDRNVRGSNRISASHPVMFRLGQRCSIPVLVFLSGGMAASNLKGVKGE
ncbi:hypothetical protein CSKR_106306 [Clonorchis sinensis]|uniref:Uncharacterized protein n=1 Tax=Clonorchis sinensis TaxID=79923 RepID=A0A419Q2D4_CLOSI|nr:hypothetical protein CSKR_106306 [Clonorchis sinensis]